jgi:hypothetical protein
LVPGACDAGGVGGQCRRSFLVFSSRYWLTGCGRVSAACDRAGGSRPGVSCGGLPAGRRPARIFTGQGVTGAVAPELDSVVGLVEIIPWKLRST